MQTQHVDFYSIPDLYDILHNPGTAKDVRLLLRMEKRYARTGRGAGESRTWLEPACGTARLLRRAAAHGVRTVGFDLEKGMIAYGKAAARAEGVLPRPRLFVAAMERFTEGRRLPRVDLAFNLINTIRHLTSDAAMLSHLRCVAEVLRPGGVYVVGLHLCAYGLDQPVEDLWTGRRAGTSITQIVQYLPPVGPRGEASRAERVISHLVVRRGRESEDITSSYALRGYSLAQWRRVIESSALRIIAVTDGAGREKEPVDGAYFLFVLEPREAETRNVTARRSRG